MQRILVGYVTIEGQTEKIAKTIERELILLGYHVDLFNVEKLHARFDFDKYSGVIIGAPVHMSRFPSTLRDWVSANAPALSKVRGAFFSVCLGILENRSEKSKTVEKKIVSDFFNLTGWHPQQWAIFAGALKYSKYGWLKKLMLKIISWRAGGDTDTSRDYEYTDWSEVRTFAECWSTQYRLNSIPINDYCNQYQSVVSKQTYPFGGTVP